MPPRRVFLLDEASGQHDAFALLPSILSEAGLPEPTIWRLGSAAILAWMAGISMLRIRQFRSGGVAAPFGWRLGAWTVLNCLIQGFNLGVGAPWPYLLGIFGILVNAFVFFLMLLLGDGGEEEPAA